MQLTNDNDLINSLSIAIELNLHPGINGTRLAQITGMPLSVIKNKFKKITTIPLEKYIKRRILANSAVALSCSLWPIHRIALEYNFDSHQSFSRAFSKNFGQSPCRYRQQKMLDWQSMQLPRIATNTTLVQPSRVEIFSPGRRALGLRGSLLLTQPMLKNTFIINQMIMYFIQWLKVDTGALMFSFTMSKSHNEKVQLHYVVSLTQPADNPLLHPPLEDVTYSSGYYRGFCFEGDFYEYYGALNSIFHYLLSHSQNQYYQMTYQHIIIESHNSPLQLYSQPLSRFKFSFLTGDGKINIANR